MFLLLLDRVDVLPSINTIAHYENFPVASLLLPRQYRTAVASIYHFARYADDLADEGVMSIDERLMRLEECVVNLSDIAAGRTPSLPLFQALRKTYQQHSFPISLCLDLLSAFKQDVVKARYQDFGEVVEYCRLSANPVGRLLLYIFKQATPRNLALSDGICTSLQLINFLQDIVIDYQKGRIYLPQSELTRFKVNEAEIAQQHFTPAFSALMQYQIERARKMLQAGAPLGRLLPGRIGLEIRTIILGGEVILRKLYTQKGNLFMHRPTLTKRDWVYMLYRAIRKK
jgi:squalene synthase HpnC